ncbi:hypothetical protein [Moritella yayanosii]|uniref:Uncharacterized protein n=1 Tax=Moritella yayanosii TaxID=69539 RepID=A0A330LKQ7_9GAMM|nr:hypothetical protein [Moritella yayanosii]SQD76796.1 protein of unknown function [Moritella yayanosii]
MKTYSYEHGGEFVTAFATKQQYINSLGTPKDRFNKLRAGEVQRHWLYIGSDLRQFLIEIFLMMKTAEPWEAIQVIIEDKQLNLEKYDEEQHGEIKARLDSVYSLMDGKSIASKCLWEVRRGIHRDYHDLCFNRVMLPHRFTHVRGDLYLVVNKQGKPLGYLGEPLSHSGLRLHRIEGVVKSCVATGARDEIAVAKSILKRMDITDEVY